MKLPKTKSFQGVTYYLDGIFGSQRTARKREERLKKQGYKARVIRFREYSDEPWDWVTYSLPRTGPLWTLPGFFLPKAKKK